MNQKGGNTNVNNSFQLKCSNDNPIIYMTLFNLKDFLNQTCNSTVLNKSLHDRHKKYLPHSHISSAIVKAHGFFFPVKTLKEFCGIKDRSSQSTDDVNGETLLKLLLFWNG